MKIFFPYLLSCVLAVFGMHSNLPSKQPTQENAPYDLTIMGAYNIYGSLSKQSVELIHALKDDLRISYIPTSKLEFLHLVSKPVQNILTTSGLVHKGKVLIMEDRFYSIPSGGLFQKFGLPEKDPEQLRYLYDMAETTKISSGWASVINSYDAVLVPDEFLVDVFTSSGVTVPVFTLPLGMYIDDFLEAKMPDRTNAKPFVFATFGWLEPRKNQIKLAQAFAQAFGNNPDVQLWISPREVFGDYEKKLLEELNQLQCPNIIYKKYCATRDMYINKYKSIDCLVNISAGEGFSYQPRESMLLQIPVIVTDNTAQSTICKSGLVRAVPSNILEPYPLPEFGHLSQCSVDDVAQALLDVYQNPKKYGTSDAKEWAMQYDFGNLKPLYLSIISPKKIIFGDINKITQNSITTNNKDLYRKWKKLFPQAKHRMKRSRLFQ